MVAVGGGASELVDAEGGSRGERERLAGGDWSTFVVLRPRLIATGGAMIRAVAGESKDLGRVRRSVELTRAEGRAAIGFLPSRIELRPTLEEKGLGALAGVGASDAFVGRCAAREIMTALHISEITGPPGRIDFVQERSLCAEDEDQWVLHTPGVEFMGGPGGWERVDADDDAVQAREPQWLLRVSRRPETPDTRGRTRCWGSAMGSLRGVRELRAGGQTGRASDRTTQRYARDA